MSVDDVAVQSVSLFGILAFADADHEEVAQSCLRIWKTPPK